MSWSERRFRGGKLATLYACLVLGFLIALVSGAISDNLVCEEGSGAGACDAPTGLAVDRAAGLLYVADDGNQRVDVFDADDRSFVRAFGWDVVKSGPGKVAAPDEQQDIALGGNTTGGNFKLGFGLSFVEDTEAIPFDASAARIESALTSLASVKEIGGSVSVGGPNGGPYMVVFGGAFAEDGVPQIRADASGLTVSGGEKSVQVTTVVQGGAFEVCEPTAGDVCKAGSPGPGSGQFSALDGIAVDNDPSSAAHQDVYVYDGVNSRVQRFHPSGEFVLMFGGGVNQTTGGDVCTGASGDTCQKGMQGFASGEFNSNGQLFAGLNGDVYVADTKGLGGGSPEDTENRLQQFATDGTHAGQCLLPTNGHGHARGLAVSSSGEIYFASDDVTGGVRKVDPACNLLKFVHPEPPAFSLNVQSLGIDQADHVFVADPTEAATSIYEYDAADELLRVFYGDGLLQSRSIAIAPYQSPSGDVYVAEPTPAGLGLARVLHLAFPPPGPVIHPQLSEANPIGNTKATLTARINPEGKASTYQFEYVDDASYDSEGEVGFSSPKTKVTDPTSLVPPDSGLDVEPLFRLAQAKADIGCRNPTTALFEAGQCLVPDTVYHFRAVAENVDGETTGREVTFKTKPPFEIGATWSGKVGTDAALLRAKVNPLNISLSGRFEYVEETVYQEDLAELGPGHGFDRAQLSAEIDFGSSEAPTVGGVQLHSLKPGTAYRYRLLVENSLDFSGDSEEHVFKTFPLAATSTCPNDALRFGASASLPDCRAYEMVTPVDKEGGDFSDAVIQSAAEVPEAGFGFAYSSSRSFGDAISAPFISQYVADRVPDEDGEFDGDEGWRSKGISPPREGAAFNGAIALGTLYKAFSEDLTFSWVQTDSEPQLSSDAISGYPNLYRRENVSGTYQAICPVAQVSPPAPLSAGKYILDLLGFSAQDDLTVFRANARLLSKAFGKNELYQLYGCKGGELRLMSVLPGGTTNTNHSSLGRRLGSESSSEDSLHNALSDDGSRLYWTGSETHNTPGKIYLRENPFGEGGECAGEGAPCTVKVSEAVGGEESKEPAHFWTAASDGSVAIFSFTAGELEDDLYEFDAESGESELIAKEVLGVVGFSEDASRLYLVSEALLGGAPGAVEGEPNLYLYEAGKGFTLVASLGGSPAGTCSVQEIPRARCSRATPDGLQLAFMSRAPLTDYDNADATSGELDAEVYLYDASANGGEGELLCVSCNPSGARPTGRQISGSPWIAAQIPGWASSFHATRALSEDGRRLFFESFDALIPADSNGVQDVYQWERLGKDGCKAESHNYFPQNGGCLDLISSGKSPQDSEFLDASADGSDVFIGTSESLLVQDPGSSDIYNARAGGGFPPPPPPKPECEGEACGSPPAPPQAITPSSSTFRGPAGKQQRCPKGKRKIKKAGKPRCIKKKRGGARRRGRNR